MDSIWSPADFEWLNEGQTAGYIPVRYPGSEKSPDAALQLGRKTEWREEAENFYRGLGHRILATDTADCGLGEVKSIQFSHPPAPTTPPLPEAGDAAVEPAPLHPAASQ